MPPQNDPAQGYLAPLQLDSNLKADAWDAYHGATSQDDFVSRMKKLNLSDAQRADLWDIKYGGGLKQQAPQAAAPAAPQPSPQVPPAAPTAPPQSFGQNLAWNLTHRSLPGLLGPMGVAYFGGNEMSPNEKYYAQQFDEWSRQHKNVRTVYNTGRAFNAAAGYAEQQFAQGLEYGRYNDAQQWQDFYAKHPKIAKIPGVREQEAFATNTRYDALKFANTLVTNPKNLALMYATGGESTLGRLAMPAFTAQALEGSASAAGKGQYQEAAENLGFAALTGSGSLHEARPFAVDTAKQLDVSLAPTTPQVESLLPLKETPVAPKGPAGDSPLRGQARDLLADYRKRQLEKNGKPDNSALSPASQPTSEAQPQESQNGVAPKQAEPIPTTIPSQGIPASAKRPTLQRRLEAVESKVDPSLDPSIQDRQRKVAHLEAALDKASDPDEIDSLLGIVAHEKRKLAQEVATGKPLVEAEPLEVSKPQPTPEERQATVAQLNIDRYPLQTQLAKARGEYDDIVGKLTRHQQAIAKGGGQYQLADNQVSFLEAERQRRLRDITKISRQIEQNRQQIYKTQNPDATQAGRPSKPQATPTTDKGIAFDYPRTRGERYAQEGRPASTMRQGPGISAGEATPSRAERLRTRNVPQDVIPPQHQEITPEEDALFWENARKTGRLAEPGETIPAETTPQPKTPSEVQVAPPQKSIAPAAVPREARSVQAAKVSQPAAEAAPATQTPDALKVAQADAKVYEKGLTLAGKPEAIEPIKNFVAARTDLDEAGRTQLYTQALKAYTHELLKNNPAGALAEAHKATQTFEVSEHALERAPGYYDLQYKLQRAREAEIRDGSLAGEFKSSFHMFKAAMELPNEVKSALDAYKNGQADYKQTQLLKRLGATDEELARLTSKSGAVPSDQSWSGGAFRALDRFPSRVRVAIARWFPTTLKEAFAMSPERATNIVSRHLDPQLMQAAHALDTKVLGSTPEDLEEHLGAYRRGGLAEGNRFSQIEVQAQGPVERLYRRVLGSLRMNDVFAHEMGHEVWDRIKTKAPAIARTTATEMYYPEAVRIQNARYYNELKPGTAQRASEVFAESFSHWYNGFDGDRAGFENFMKKIVPDVYDKVKHLAGQGKLLDHMPQPTPDGAAKAIEDWKTTRGDAPYETSAGAMPQVPVTDPDMKTIHDAQDAAKNGKLSLAERIAMLPKSIITKLHDKFNFFPGAHGPANVFDTQGVNLSQRAIEKRIGRPLNNEENPYVQFRLMDGGGAGPATSYGIKMGDIIHDAEQSGLLHKTREVLNLHGYNRAISVIEEKRAAAAQEFNSHQAQHNAISQAINNGSLKLADGQDALASARRGMRRAQAEYKMHDDTLANNEAVPMGMDKTAIQQKLQDIQQQLGPSDYQKVQDYSSRVWDLNSKVWKNLHAAGVITDDMFNKGVARGPEYIPMNRILDVVKDSPNNGGRGLDLKTENIIHELLGSDKINKDPFDASMGHISLAWKEIQRNVAARQLVDFRKTDPQGWGQLIRDLSPTDKPRKGEGVIGYYEKGEPVRFAIPEDLAQIIRNSHPQDVSILGRALSTFSSTYRRLLTVANLTYTVPRFLRDISEYQSLSHASKGPVGFLKMLTHDYPLAVKDVIQRSPDFHDALMNRALGGTFQSLITPDVWQDQKGVFGNLVRGNALKAVEHFNAYAENAAKVMSWKELKRQGYADTENAWETRNMAGTPDFAQTGTMSKEANLLWMFINADIKANTRTLHRLVSEPRRLALLAATSAGVALAAYRHNSQFTDEDGNPELDHVSDNDKRNYFIIITPEKYQTSQGAIRNRVVKVYKPPLYRQIYNPIASVIEQAGRGKWDFEQTGLDFMSSVLPGQFYLKKGNVAGTAGQGVESSLNPIVREPLEQAANQDSYTGAPIVPRALQDVEPPDKTTPLTSPVVQGAARAIYKAAPGLNKVPVVGPMLTEPARLQHAVTNTTGGMGEMALSAADTIYNKATGKPTQATNTGLPLEGDEKVASTPVAGPILRRFVGSRQDQVEKNLEQSFYDYAAKVRAFQNSFQLKSKADPEGLKESLKDPRTLKFLSTIEEVSDIEKQLSEIRDAQLAIQRSKAAPAARQQAMHALYKGRIKLLQVFDQNIRPQLETLQ